MEPQKHPDTKRLRAAHALRVLQEAISLLQEALECVEADEAARRESWPEEVGRGELTLDLAGRIRTFLSRAEDPPVVGHTEGVW